MLYWIRTFAAITGCFVFFALFFICMAGSPAFTLDSLGLALVRAIVGGSLAWVVGIVIADILFKGVLGDIAGDKQELLEGGLLQRIHDIRSATVPGGAEMPFAPVTAAGKKTRG